MSTDTPPRTPVNACDFYVGRTEEAVLVGTRHSAGAPWHIPLWTHLQQHTLGGEFTALDFVEQVRRWVDGMPDHGAPLDQDARWPHRYATSADTAWTLCYDRGSIYLYHYGVEMAVLRCNYGKWTPAHIADPEHGDPLREVYAPRKPWGRFPDMIGRER